MLATATTPGFFQLDLPGYIEQQWRASSLRVAPRMRRWGRRYWRVILGSIRVAVEDGIAEALMVGAPYPASPRGGVRCDRMVELKAPLRLYDTLLRLVEASTYRQLWSGDALAELRDDLAGRRICCDVDTG
jgi:hypothetical protein